MLTSMENGSWKPAATATCAQVSNLVATVCLLVFEKILSLSSMVAKDRAEGSAAIWTASLLDPRVYGAMPCPSLLGGTKSIEDDGSNEGPDEDEVLIDVREGTEDNEGHSEGDVTSDDCEDTKDDRSVVVVAVIAAPSSSGRRVRLGAATDTSGNKRDCRGGIHST
jgi:hypothetical protein